MVSPYDLPILPSTNVGALLDRYPQLEDVLIELAPPFKKLKSPLLRKGVGKVASLKQAAAVAGMAAEELVNKLRAAVGQEPIGSSDAGSSITYSAPQPQWFTTSKIVMSIDARISEETQMPIVRVLQEAARLQRGEILELVTTFIPAPGIEIVRSKGLQVWWVKQGQELIRTYILKSCD